MPIASGRRSGFERRDAIGAGAIGIAGALFLTSLLSPQLLRAAGEEVGAGLSRAKTVAAMLAERSPGQRPEGALANLKHKRQVALHERALPKVRGPGPAAYEARIGPPPAPAIPMGTETPLFTAAGGPPPVEVTTAAPGGGPPGLSNIPLPGGGGGSGGGGFTPPTVAATPSVPTVPVAPVPEPGTWAMMILGLAMIGRALRRGPVPLRS